MYNIILIAFIVMIIMMGVALAFGWILLRFRNKKTYTRWRRIQNAEYQYWADNNDI